MATTLYSYYKSKGKSLPSLSSRARLYQKYGLGSASSYRGTAKQNVALLRKLQGRGGVSSKKVQVPKTRVTGVAKKVKDATAGYKAQIRSMQRMKERAQREREAAKKEREVWKRRLGEVIKRGPRTKELTEQLYEKYRIDEQYEQIMAHLEQAHTYREELIAVEQEEAERLTMAEQRLAPTTFIRGEQALIQRQYEIRKNTLASQVAAEAAVAEALQGNVELARGLVSDMVKAATYDYERRVEDIKTFIDINNTIISQAGEDLRFSMNSLLEQARAELENAREEKRLVGELMYNYPEVKITPNMTLEQAYRAARRAASIRLQKEERRFQQQLAASRAASRAGTSYPSSYEEWKLAGGKKGTGYTYAEWLMGKKLKSGSARVGGLTRRGRYVGVGEFASDWLAIKEKVKRGINWLNKRIEKNFIIG